MSLNRLAAIAVLLFATPAAANPAPADFALRMPVHAEAGAGVQRLELPARALVASRSENLADLRLFDARGQSLPIARLAPSVPAIRREVALPVLPILGRPGTLRVTGATLTLDERDGTRVARIDGTVDPTAEAVVLGNLLDTRKVADPATALRLTAELPVAQPVLMIVEASANLRDWQPVAQKMLYRASATAALEPIDLGHADLNGRYLRLRWRADAPLIAPVVLREAVLETQAAGAARPLHVVRLESPVLANAHDIRLSLPFRTPVVAMEITPARPGVLVPVTLFGRDNAERPWVPLGAGTVVRMDAGGTARQATRVPLSAGPTASIRIEADSRTAGFDALPAIDVLIEPVSIAFVASGTPPYELAVGHKSAEPVWLPAASLSPAGVAPDSLPLAQVADAGGPLLVSAAPEADGSKRRALLWGILILATVALAAMALKLRRG